MRLWQQIWPIDAVPKATPSTDFVSIEHDTTPLLCLIYPSFLHAKLNL